MSDAYDAMDRAVSELMAETQPGRHVVEWVVTVATVDLEEPRGQSLVHTREPEHMLAHHVQGLLQAGLDLQVMGEADGDAEA